AEFTYHRFVLVDNAPLEEAEALLHVAAEVQIHARFVILESVAAAQYPAEGDVQRNAEVERQGRTDGEAIEVPHPAPAHAAGYVAREGRKSVTVGADDASSPERRQDLAFGAVREIRGMDQAEGGRRE